MYASSEITQISLTTIQSNGAGMCCMDDRIPRTILEKVDHRAAGTLVLHGTVDQAAEIVDNHYGREGRTPTLFAHVRCAAAMLYVKEFLGLQGTSGEEADRRAAEFIQEVAVITGSNYGEINRLNGNPDVHHATAATWSPAGTIPQLDPRFADTYGLTRGYNPMPDYKAAQLALALEVATGPHGANGDITEETPFVIHVMGFRTATDGHIHHTLASMLKVVDLAMAKFKGNHDILSRVRVKPYEIVE